ncbi:MAG: DEAD/DEAH box helicase family protein [Lachnospiraceae bacterium]|nr:DEAD/DEAH box helicase family protein [Lachnospiraceae bacterium]
MAAKKQEISLDFAFSEWLWYYYSQNRGKIRSRYRQLTKKFLDYNDKAKNADAFLRQPQFEALEMYVFIKEFLDNMQVSEMFYKWINREGDFSDSSYYSIHKSGQQLLLDAAGNAEDQNKYLFEQMKAYQEAYPNYIYALTMGLGKTYLMATCIFYEFLLARTYPKDEKYCHNALIFAPDKTVLQTLHSIVTFDKSKVVPPEYAWILDSNIKFHFLDDTNISLDTVNDSDYNIIISNTQKIIVKKKHKEPSAKERLYKMPAALSKLKPSDDVILDETALKDNIRFKKLCRLPQLGVYVDEAHHLFGSELEKSLRRGKKDDDDSGKTSLRGTINILAKATKVVACYNFTGTPYVGSQILPEVVYSCALYNAIHNKYLKQADPHGYENVKNEDFLREAISTFLEKYGGQKYEYLNPKMAIYAASIDEAENVVRPTVEKILSDLNYDTNTILVNNGNTKHSDIKLFYDLDVPNSEGDKKQFIILVGKGTEGWDCRSLFAVAMFRNPNSATFVLQATMRCMRQITDTQQTASIFLSKENWDILNLELHNNFGMSIEDLSIPNSKPKRRCEVRVLPPPRIIKLKFVSRTYKCVELKPTEPINFNLSALDLEKYKSYVYTKESITSENGVIKTEANHIRTKTKYSKITLVAELSRYLNIPCIKLSRIISNSVDGIDKILDLVNEYNSIIEEVITPCVFRYLYKLESEDNYFEKEVTLLKAPKDPDYYEFHAQDNMIVTKQSNDFSKEDIKKSFHADTYCFDSNPERSLFYQYIKSDKVKEIYFTGMFTSNHSDFSVYYYDPDSGRLRKYYPDFLAKMNDDTYQIIEVKQDNMIEDSVVNAKKLAAEQLASANKMKYIMFPGKVVTDMDIINDVPFDLSPKEMSELRNNRKYSNMSSDTL